MFSTSCRQLRHTTLFDATSRDCVFSTSCCQLRHTTMFDATSRDCVFSTSCRQLRHTTMFDATSRDCVFSTSCRQLRHTTVFNATSNGNAADLSQLSQGITHSPDCSTVAFVLFLFCSYTTHTGGIPTKNSRSRTHTWVERCRKNQIGGLQK